MLIRPPSAQSGDSVAPTTTKERWFNPMDIKALTKKRLRQQLADEKTAFEARQVAELAKADAHAAKAELDAIAVAKAQALDEERRLTAEWAQKLNDVMG